jgi:hypothetical protein
MLREGAPYPRNVREGVQEQTHTPQQPAALFNHPRRRATNTPPPKAGRDHPTGNRMYPAPADGVRTRQTRGRHAPPRIHFTPAKEPFALPQINIVSEYDLQIDCCNKTADASGHSNKRPVPVRTAPGSYVRELVLKLRHGLQFILGGVIHRAIGIPTRTGASYGGRRGGSRGAGGGSRGAVWRGSGCGCIRRCGRC